jgi:hypothetical protein
MAYLATTYGSSRSAFAPSHKDAGAKDRFSLFAVALSFVLLALAFVAHANGFSPPGEDSISAQSLAP